MPDDDILTDESRADGTRNRSRLTWMVAVVVVLVIAGAVAFALLDRDDEPDVPGEDRTGAGSPSSIDLVVEPSTDRCMVPNAEVLRLQSTAFDGVVTSVTAGQATLEPTRFYTGPEAEVVTVQAPDRDLQALLVALDFREGDRYLVAATEGRVTLCGFSGRYTEELAALYAEAFGG